MTEYTPEAMRIRFWQAFGEKEKLLARTQGMRSERETLYTEMGPLEDRAKELAANIKTIEHPTRANLDMELAMIARALSNKVGERPSK